MENLSMINSYFKKYMEDLSLYLPEGVEEIDILTLFDRDLIDFDKEKEEGNFTRLFQIVETEDRITLLNEQFIIWILPQKNEESSSTFILIALNKKEEPHPEKGFLVSGVYNTSKVVLSLLERELNEIQENEALLQSFV